MLAFSYKLKSALVMVFLILVEGINIQSVWMNLLSLQILMFCDVQLFGVLTTPYEILKKLLWILLTGSLELLL